MGEFASPGCRPLTLLLLPVLPPSTHLLPFQRSQHRPHQPTKSLNRTSVALRSSATGFIKLRLSSSTRRGPTQVTPVPGPV